MNSSSLNGRLTMSVPFPRSFVLNFRGDDLRWNSFLESNGWSDQPSLFVRVPTVDPQKVIPPSRWQGTPREWMILRGLLSVFEHCLSQSIPCAMVLNDDARFVANSREIQSEFAAELPVDWRFLVFGGRHEHLSDGVPAMVSHKVYRPYSVSKACVFAWRGYPMLHELYHFAIRSSAASSGPREFSALCRKNPRGHYVPDRWLFRSEETGDNPDAAAIIKPVMQRVVAVLGFFRGGTSCVAGVLHKLGIPMGDEMLPTDPINPFGYFECRKLHRLSRLMFDNPSMARKLPSAQIIGLLRRWALERVGTSNTPCIGGKHPALCCLGQEMQIAWPNCRFIVVDRDAADIVKSIVRTTWGWSFEEATLNTSTLLKQREQFLQSLPPSQYLRVDFNRLRSNTQSEVQRIAEWLGVPLNSDRIATAVAHVVS